MINHGQSSREWSIVTNLDEQWTFTQQNMCMYSHNQSISELLVLMVVVHQAELQSATGMRSGDLGDIFVIARSSRICSAPISIGNNYSKCVQWKEYYGTSQFLRMVSGWQLLFLFWLENPHWFPHVVQVKCAHAPWIPIDFHRFPVEILNLFQAAIEFPNVPRIFNRIFRNPKWDSIGFPRFPIDFS